MVTRHGRLRNLLNRLRVCAFMKNETTPASAIAEARIGRALDAIRGMSRDLAEEVTPPPTWRDRLSSATREAPIPSLAIAFLIGFIVTRR